MKIFHFDFNTAFYNRPYLEKFIRQLKSWHYDTLLWELEDFVRWDHLAFCGQSDSISKDEMAEILRFAESLGMDNIPLVQCLGHCEYVLSKPEYAHLADAPGQTAPYCPTNPGVRKFLKELLTEDMELFHRSCYIHLGCDEVWRLGDQCPSCQAAIAAKGKAELLADHINFLNDVVNAAGKEAMIWADMLLIHPHGVANLAKNIIMVDWRYELRDDRKKLWLWDEKGGRLIDETEITGDMRENFGKYLYKDGRLNIFYTTDFLLDHGFRVITAGASACYPDNFLLGKTVDHVYNACAMMRKGVACFGYLHTSWTVHLFDYELQPAIAAVRPTEDCAAVLEEYARQYFDIPGKRFFELCMMLEPRVLFAAAGSTGSGKEVKEPPENIVARRLQEYQQAGTLADELAAARTQGERFTAALAGLRELRKSVTRNEELFDRYILAAEALVNRAAFGVMAASEQLHLEHGIDRGAVEAEMRRLRAGYRKICGGRLTPEHADRTVRILFDTLLEYF